MSPQVSRPSETPPLVYVPYSVFKALDYISPTILPGSPLLSAGACST